MRATAPHETGAGRPVTVSATSNLVTASAGDNASDRRAANSDDYRPKFRRVVEVATERIERAMFGAVQRLRGGLERRRTVRELRLLGRSRLADIGIDPNDIGRVVDDLIAARRSRMAAGERRPRTRTE